MLSAELAALLTPRRLAAWGAGLLVLTIFVYLHTILTPGHIDRAGRFKGSDYVQFYVMGSLLVDGRVEALYDGDAHLAEGRRRIDPDLGLYAAHPNYGPQMALAFAPLSLLPFGWSFAMFLAVMVGIYGLSVWLIWRECDALAGHGRLVAVLAAASPALWSMVRYGQLSALPLLFWAIALVAWRRGRPFAAGLAIGCLAFKPQLGLVIGIVLMVGREWRAVCGAAVAVCGQLAVGWAVAGQVGLGHYFATLRLLMSDPSLVQLHPSEVHSLRGVLQLLDLPPGLLALGFWLAFVVLVAVAVRSWTSSAPVSVRLGQIVLLSILAAPHLLTYDLVLLTLPLMVSADWCVRHFTHVRRPAVALALVPVFLAPFSSNLARLTWMQTSVLAMALLASRLLIKGSGREVLEESSDDQFIATGGPV